jgi:GT2 family glycosyltransferase
MEQASTAHGLPELSVVVCTLGRSSVADTAASVRESADRAGRRVEVIVVWQDAEQPDRLGADRVVEVYPVGLAHARNRGLTVAEAPLVAFVDDDELVDPGWVAGVLAGFEDGITAVLGPVEPLDDRGLAYCRYQRTQPQRFRGRSTPPWRIGTGGNMAFRREALRDLGGFDPLFGIGAISRSAEDTEALLRVLRADHVIAWAPDAVVYHPTKTASERLASRFPYAYGLGKLVRRHREPVLAARYAREIGQAFVGAGRARDRRRLREARETLRGFVSGAVFEARPASPEHVLEDAPGEIEAELLGAGVVLIPPSYRPDPHFVYRAGDRVLHVYVNPAPRLRAGLLVRERARASGAEGIPAVHACVEGRDTLWLVEDWLSGHAPRGAPARWFGGVAGWALSMGVATGGPVGGGEWWAEKAGPALAVAPSESRETLAAALELVAELPAHRTHGDLQPKNILVADSTRIGVLDWEHAYEDGPPGADLLFLAAMSRGARPDSSLVRLLAHGVDPGSLRLRPALQRAGVPDDRLREWLLVLLAVWAGDEARRVGTPGMPRSDRRYAHLLAEIAPLLS